MGEVRRGIDPEAGTLGGGMIEGGTGAGADPETENAVVPHTVPCPVTERTLVTKGTVGAGEGTGKKSVGVGPDHRFRKRRGQLGQLKNLELLYKVWKNLCV